MRQLYSAEAVAAVLTAAETQARARGGREITCADWDAAAEAWADAAMAGEMLAAFLDAAPEATVADVMAEFDLSDTEAIAALEAEAVRYTAWGRRRMAQSERSAGDGEA
jgi:hypothetical protein